MAAHQYRDLPQIPPTIDERISVWGVDNMHCLPSCKQHSFAFAPEQDSVFNDFDGDLLSMQPMQRFMLDQYPLTAGVLNAKISMQDEWDLPIDQWPTADCLRTASPDRTSSSGISSQAPQSELRSPHVYNSITYTSPVDFVQPSLAYSTTEVFNGGNYLASATKFAGSISLREIEYEHAPPEPEPVAEDIAIDLKQETPCAQETIEVKAQETTPITEYADSGIGNSVRDAESVQPIDSAEDSSDLDWSPKPRSPKRRRSMVCNSSSTRAAKRQAHARKDSSVSTASSASTSTTTPKKTSRRPSKSSTILPSPNTLSTITATESRPFPCPLTHYGCTSAFSSKNEWKRHVATQHVKTGFWRCDLCRPHIDTKHLSVQPHDFNRKDLFTQHLRRMHGPLLTAGAAEGVQVQGQAASHTTNVIDTEPILSLCQARCFHSLRSPPLSASCLFCERVFTGKNAWDERMEHVGRHLEKDRETRRGMLDATSWRRDEALERYLVDEGIVDNVDGGWTIGAGIKRADHKKRKGRGEVKREVKEEGE